MARFCPYRYIADIKISIYSLAVDPFGDHAMCCPKAGLWDRHRAVQLFLHEAACEHRVPCALERTADPTTRDRPGDVMFPDWDRGVPLFVDLSVHHPLAPSAGAETLEDAGRGFESVARHQTRQYAA